MNENERNLLETLAKAVEALLENQKAYLHQEAKKRNPGTIAVGGGRVLSAIEAAGLISQIERLRQQL